MLNNWRARFEEELNWEAEDGAHDLGHCRSVWANVVKIVEGMNVEVDNLVLLAASYLHDQGAAPKNSPLRSQSSKMSADWAEKWLRDRDFPGEKLENVRDCIESHSFSANRAPRSLEAKIFQDADRLDALGAKGVARCFYVGGQMKTQLFDARDPLAEKRELNDERYTVDHFFKKLFLLPDMMQTEFGKKLGQERVGYMRGFIRQLFQESDSSHFTSSSK